MIESLNLQDSKKTAITIICDIASQESTDSGSKLSADNLLFLNMGDIISGTILSSCENQDGSLGIKLSIDNKVLTAESTVPIKAGEELTFQVLKISPKVELQLINPSLFNNLNDSSFISILRSGETHILELFTLIKKFAKKYPFHHNSSIS